MRNKSKQTVSPKTINLGFTSEDQPVTTILELKIADPAT